MKVQVKITASLNLDIEDAPIEEFAVAAEEMADLLGIREVFNSVKIEVNEIDG